jgi:cytochrome P450
MNASETATLGLLESPDTWANPYPVYRLVREHSPVSLLVPRDSAVDTQHRVPLWMLLKHDQVYAALRDHGTFSSDFSGGGPDGPKLVLLQDDPPRHTHLRRLVNRAFTPRRVAELEPWIRAVARDLLDGIGGDSVDIVERYTVPLPVTVIARLMGIPGEDYLTFKRWSDAFIASHGVSPEERVASTNDMVAYFGRMAAERRARRAEDLITALVEATIEGESLREPEILGFCILLLIAGNETTTNLISNMLNLLAVRPDLWRQLRDDRSLVEPLIEESLRYESPVQFLQRWATRDVEVGEATIPRGCEVLISFGAANRDPDAFPEPDDVRLDRGLSSHVAFGMGIHYCLGAPLARLEATITLNSMLDRYESIAPGDSLGVRQRATPIVFGFQELPLRCTVRTAGA